MAHFAQIDDNNVVISVIIAEQDFINSGVLGDPSKWIQTSYNTKGGIHYGPDGQPDGGLALRKNYAGPGFTYDKQHDAFIPPQPYVGWVLNQTTFLWEPPTPRPTDGREYVWDVETVSWRDNTSPKATPVVTVP